MRYIRLCIISLLATLPLAVHASPQPLEQIKLSESQLSRPRRHDRNGSGQRPHADRLARR